MFILLFACRNAAPPPAPTPPPAITKTLNLPPYGNLTVHHPVPVEKAVKLILWLGASPVPVVKTPTPANPKAPPAPAPKAPWEPLSADSIVVEIPTLKLRQSAEGDSLHCWDAGRELALLGRETSRILGMTTPLQPLLWAEDEAAGLAFAAIMQSPEELFGGLVATGFQPQLDFGRPFCPYRSWEGSSKPIQLTTRADLLPRSDGARVLLKNTSRTDMSGFWTQAVSALEKDPIEVLKSWKADQPPLPPPEPATTLAAPLTGRWPSGATMGMILFSGEEGWTQAEESLLNALFSSGIGVLGLDLQAYLWQAKNKEEVGKLLNDLMATVPTGTRIITGGFGLGGTILASLSEQLPPASPLILLDPAPILSYEVTPMALLLPQQKSTGPSLESLLGGRPALCLEGDSRVPSTPELKSVTYTPRCPKSGARVMELSGGSRFGGRADELARRILEFLTTLD